jgi:hypothetical protein
MMMMNFYLDVSFLGSIADDDDNAATTAIDVWIENDGWICQRPCKLKCRYRGRQKQNEGVNH